MALPPTRASGPFRPTRLGQWEVIAKIAGGGMSAVYLGRRVEPAPDVPNVVALKIVRHDVAMDERLLEMFLAEGRLIARLVHPNIVRTLEVGGDAQQDFIAMELMLGKTFAAIHEAMSAKGVRLSPEIAAWTAARIADALHYAHELTDEHGRPLALVHRDVNPANVFATFKGEAKLFDFGLAKVTAGEATGSQLLAGKLSYLSPEQIMQMPLDRRSDIFSLGTTLWELLTSRRLFRRDSDVDTVRAVQLGPIPDVRAAAPDVPEDLARIAKTALERNRDHRYPSAADLARELDAFVLSRSSPEEVSGRLAHLVDALFPGEHKRQSGWLKPAITSSISRLMSSVTPATGSTSAARPAPPDVRRDSRETTVVMANAPPVPASSRDTATTARDGVPAALSGSASWPVPSSRGPSAPPPPARSRAADRAPSSRTDIQAAPPPPDSRTEIQRVSPVPSTPPSAPSAPPRPPSASIMPKPGASVAPKPGASVAPKPGASVAPKPGASVAPRAASVAPRPTAPDAGRESSPGERTSALPGSGPRQRPKRVPIPLPSRSRPATPKRAARSESGVAAAQTDVRARRPGEEPRARASTARRLRAPGQPAHAGRHAAAPRQALLRAAMPTPTHAIELVQLFDRLAALPRTGWLLRGVVDPESIAEHSFGVCVVATLLIDDLRERGVAVDGERVLRMALLHDLAEVFTGDVPMPAKTESLDAALEQAEELLLGRVLAPAQLALWREAEDGETLEARVVKAADKVQMLVKALTYEQQRRGHLDEFWDNAKNRRHMDLDFARELFAELARLAAASRGR